MVLECLNVYRLYYSHHDVPAPRMVPGRFLFCFVFFLMELGVEFKGLHLLVRYSTT
jgi:hypothetical protein